MDDGAASGTRSTSASSSPSTTARPSGLRASTGAWRSASCATPWGTPSTGRPGASKEPVPSNQHGGEDRAAHPHVHALLSPRFDDKSPVHLSPRAIQAVRERWEREVLRGLERQEQRLEHARREHTPVSALTPYNARDRASPQLELMPTTRQRRRFGPVGVLFLRTKKARRAARLGGRWLDRLVRPER
jgi:hypothetical protein